MSKIFKTGLLSAAAMALATTAMAAGQLDAQNYGVDVNIVVEPEVSMWANDDVVTLTMDGADGNNSATAESSITVINNVDAKVDATVAGTLPGDSQVGGTGISFFIFEEEDAANAVAAITGNAYTPAGALVWNDTNMGTTQNLIPSVGVNQTVSTREIVYASSAPGDIPLPATYPLTVTWTITAN